MSAAQAGRTSSPTSVLVTGGAGFIGSHLIDGLLASTDARIVCLDDFNDYYDPALKRANVEGFAADPRVAVVEGTFTDPEAMDVLFAREAFSDVVHLGAYAGVRPSIARPFIYERTNVGGTLVLLETVRRHPVERFVLASSSTVYGRDAATPFVEDAPLGTPMSPYGATKRAAEILGLTYAQLHGVPVVAVRPFSVYGPRLRPDLALTIFTQALLDGRSIPLFGDGSIRRDFTHVRDICGALLTAMTADDVVGEIINLGHSDPIEIRELIAELERATGVTARIDWQPEQPGEMPVTFADLTKARRLLDYRPTVEFREGVHEFVDWFMRGAASR